MIKPRNSYVFRQKHTVKKRKHVDKVDITDEHLKASFKEPDAKTIQYQENFLRFKLIQESKKTFLQLLKERTSALLKYFGYIF